MESSPGPRPAESAPGPGPAAGRVARRSLWKKKTRLRLSFPIVSCYRQDPRLYSLITNVYGILLLLSTLSQGTIHLADIFIEAVVICVAFSLFNIAGTRCSGCYPLTRTFYVGDVVGIAAGRHVRILPPFLHQLILYVGAF